MKSCREKKNKHIKDEDKTTKVTEETDSKTNHLSTSEATTTKKIAGSGKFVILACGDSFVGKNVG
jgi:hypothetical protein